MTNEQISKTWEANYLPYIKITENGIRSVSARRKSFDNWVETLIELGNIQTRSNVKYTGTEI